MQNNNTEGQNPDFKELLIEDTCYKTLFTEKFVKKTPWVKPDEKRVCAYLPGTLIKLHVKKGETVKKGQPLLVFEAMKMMNTVKSAFDGVIKDIVVKPGDKFPKNHLLLEFE